MSKKVPRGLGFGAAPLGNAQPAISQKDALAALESAHANGIRYFDTAPLYGRGRSESFIGEFLASESRNDLVLSTKAGRLLRGGGFIYDYSFDGVMRSIDESLERLRVEYLDLVYMHDIGEQTHGNDHRRVMTEAIDGGFKALARLKDEGVIGALGIGVNETAVCMEALAAVDLDYVMLAGRYTLLDTELDDLGSRHFGDPGLHRWSRLRAPRGADRARLVSGRARQSDLDRGRACGLVGVLW